MPTKHHQLRQKEQETDRKIGNRVAEIRKERMRENREIRNMKDRMEKWKSNEMVQDILKEREKTITDKK